MFRQLRLHGFCSFIARDGTDDGQARAADALPACL